MSRENDITPEEQRAMIERACATEGLTPTHWDEDEEDDDRLRAWVGQAQVFEDDEDAGLYEGDVGGLFATVVGGREQGNLSVAWYLRPEGFDAAVRCEPGVNVELV